MKTKIKKAKPETFTPIKITITIECIEDLREFRDILGSNNNNDLYPLFKQLRKLCDTFI